MSAADAFRTRLEARLANILSDIQQPPQMGAPVPLQAMTQMHRMPQMMHRMPPARADTSISILLLLVVFMLGIACGILAFKFTVERADTKKK